MTDTKTCTKCGVEKPLGEFSRHNGSPDGYTPACRHCRAVYNRQRRAGQIIGKDEQAPLAIGIPAQREAWQQQAACRGLDPNLFFPERVEGGASTNAEVAAAQTVCSTCPVQFPCLEYAMRCNEMLGVWGGLSVKARKNLRARRNRGAA